MVGIKPTIKNSRPLKSSLIPKSMNSPTGRFFLNILEFVFVRFRISSIKRTEDSEFFQKILKFSSMF
jgi:hypothetical protein